MKKNKIILFALITIICMTLVSVWVINRKNKTELIVPFTGKTIQIESTNGLTINADLYLLQDSTKPFIILFHQAGYSRGEYRPIAPRLNQLGYNCIAIDQRSGESVNDVINETAKSAKELSLKTDYISAFPDIEASLKYTHENFKPNKVIIWGSSYSASLVLIMASKYKKEINAVIAFSPGEYFTYEGKMIKEYSKQISCPCFITSTKDESSSLTEIFNNINCTTKIMYVPEGKGKHGSSALWSNQSENEKYWKVLIEFLQQLK